MIYRSGSNKSISSEFRNLGKYDDNIFPYQEGFKFAISFTNSLAQAVPLNPAYFTLEVMQTTVTYNGGATTVDFTDLEYELCDIEKEFAGQDEYFSRGATGGLYCPKNNNYKVAGNYLAENYQFITIKLKKCSTGCAPDAAIKAVLEQSFLNNLMVNSYVDFDDYETPVKNYMDDRYSYRGVSTMNKRARIFIKENAVDLTDSLLPLGGSTEQSFLSVDSTDHDVQAFLGTSYLEVMMVLDPEKTTYSRVVFSFFDLFGMLGGVFEILSILCGLIVGLFSKHILLFSMFKKLYHTENDIGEDYQKHNYGNHNIGDRNHTRVFPMEESKSKLQAPTDILDGRYDGHRNQTYFVNIFSLMKTH